MVDACIVGVDRFTSDAVGFAHFAQGHLRGWWFLLNLHGLGQPLADCRLRVAFNAPVSSRDPRAMSVMSWPSWITWFAKHYNPGPAPGDPMLAAYMDFWRILLPEDPKLFRGTNPTSTELCHQSGQHKIVVVLPEEMPGQPNMYGWHDRTLHRAVAASLAVPARNVDGKWRLTHFTRRLPSETLQGTKGNGTCIGHGEQNPGGAREVLNLRDVQLQLAALCGGGACSYSARHMPSRGKQEPVRSQVANAAATDIMVTTHGAQANLAMFMPDDSVVVEVYPPLVCIDSAASPSVANAERGMVWVHAVSAAPSGHRWGSEGPSCFPLEFHAAKLKNYAHFGPMQKQGRDACRVWNPRAVASLLRSVIAACPARTAPHLCARRAAQSWAARRAPAPGRNRTLRAGEALWVLRRPSLQHAHSHLEVADDGAGAADKPRT